MGAAIYLLIGHDDDLCCREVADVLRARAARVIVTPEPLAGEVAFSWAFGARPSSSSLRLADGTRIDRDGLAGVLVRAQGGPVEGEGWTVEDLAYARTETSAALVAWLWDLPCPVVNRLTPDLWFGFRRPLVEWRPLLLRHGIPAANGLICGDAAAARGFARRWGGVAVYAPLTSRARYPVADEASWAELAKISAQLPVCLLEPSVGAAAYACVAGGVVVWQGRELLSGGERAAMESGLRSLAAGLGLGLIEAEVRRAGGGARCYGLELFPWLERYDTASRDAIVGALAGSLGVVG